MNSDEITKSEVPAQQKLEFWRRPKVLIPCATLLVIMVVVGVSWLGYRSYAEDQRLDAESVTLKEVRTIEVGETKKVSDFLENLNGTLVADSEIASEKIGDVEVSFDYINIKNKRRNIKFKVKAVDSVAPEIYGGEKYTINLGHQGDLTNLMLSGDNVDDDPRREILGEYDVNKLGRYKLEYVITDASGNQTKQPFTLNVVRASNDSNPIATPKVPLAKVVKQFKNDGTKVGVDVSEWQGEIDWQKVKDAGVEFAFIRVGYQTEFGGEYILDSYFMDNLRAANEMGLETGVYFYSYADSVDEAKNQARWVKSQISGFEVPLGVAFDWESWGEFNGAGMSFRKINKVAEAFMDEISGGDDAKYQAMLYSSKTYLDKIWTNTKYATWLAQYYDEPTYTGEYQYWQMTNAGQVSGIYGDVDIDIMYLGKES